METVLLTNCGTSFEADVIKSVLDGAGIPCMIVDHKHVAMWSFQGPDTIGDVPCLFLLVLFRVFSQRKPVRFQKAAHAQIHLCGFLCYARQIFRLQQQNRQHHNNQ